MVQTTLNNFKEEIVCEVEQTVISVGSEITVQSRFGKQYKPKVASNISKDNMAVYDHVIVRKYSNGNWVIVKNLGNPNKVVDNHISSDAFVEAFMNY